MLLLLCDKATGTCDLLEDGQCLERLEVFVDVQLCLGFALPDDSGVWVVFGVLGGYSLLL